MSGTILIRGGRVIDPGTGRDGVYNLLIRDGKIAAKKYGATYIVRRETIDWWTTQQKLFAES